MEAQAPTIEWQRNNSFESPQLDQKRAQYAYRRLSPFETLRKSDEIDAEMLRAADKFAKHYWGSLGHDVRTDEGCIDDPIEFRQSYHQEKLAQAKSALIVPAFYDAIESQVQENMILVELGQSLRTVKRREIARNIAVTTLRGGLEILAYHWGFKTRPPD